MKKTVLIKAPYITLGQMLKEEGVISTGGQAKWYLHNNTVMLNDEPENRRGKKLVDGDNVSIPDIGMFFIRSEQD